MPFDRYMPCPCGTGKKVKFCCEDLLSDLEAIQNMLEGEQRLACLEYIDKLLETHPDRACLLAIKTLLHSEMEQNEALEKTLQHFEAKHPENPLAAAERAIQLAEAGNAKQAVLKLQQALATVVEQMPIRVYEAIGILGRALLAEGNVLAARAHLLLQASIGGSEDPRAMSLLAPLIRSPEVPLLLRDEQPLIEAEEESPEVQEAVELASKGRWLEGADRLAALAQQQSTAAVVGNLAILQSWLAQVEQAATNWKKYAALDSLDPDQAIEAEAIGQLIDPEAEFTTVALVCHTLEMEDIDPLLALFSANPQMEILGDTQAGPLQEEGQPPPRLVFLLLDREMPASGKGLTLEALPRVLGQGYLFGRETDRSARLEFVLYQDEQSAPTLELLKKIAEGGLQNVGQEQVLSEVPDIERKMAMQTRVPPDTPVEDRERLAAEKQKWAIFHIWPELPQPALDGKTPRAVAKKEKGNRSLQAAILVLETSHATAGEIIDFNRLREELQLPLPQPISPEGINPDRLPMVRMDRVIVDEMSDAWLLHAYRRAAMVAATSVLARLAPEVIKRESLSGQVDKAEACGLLAGGASTSEQAIEWLTRAREWAANEKESPARWLLAELDLRLRRGEATEAQQLLGEIQTHHIREPGIAQALFELLARYGIVDPRAANPANMPPAAAPQPGDFTETAPSTTAESEQKIWTPEGSPSGEQKKSTIWTPDD